jgi:[ribosomal protein S5]-alanine N-acetyltransferase
VRVLRTLRLTLEPVTLSNADALWRIMQAGGLREYQDVPRYSLDEFRDRVAARPTSFHPQASGRFEWLIALSVTRAPLGWVSLRLGEDGAGTAEMGYSLLESGRGFGYAGEGVRAVLDEAFLEAGMEAVEAACVVGNDASLKVLKKLGFAQVRLQRNGAVVRSRAVDIYVFRMDGTWWKQSPERHT